MNIFDKALEAEQLKLPEIFDAVPTLDKYDAYNLGATWSRDFTIAEVCEWLRDKNSSPEDQGYAEGIEQHFNKQKEGK